MSKQIVKKKVDPEQKKATYAKGPTYLPQNPKSTPEQNEYRAKENINRALQFKSNLRGTAGVSTQYTPREHASPNMKLKEKQSRDISVQRVDPVAVHKADSVLATRDPGMMARKKIIKKKY